MSSGENSSQEEQQHSFDDWDDRYFDDRASASGRSNYERDRDRVLYSDGFKRLSGITQVARTGEAYPYHTRLIHSLKVSQVGRRIAQYVNREYNLTPDSIGGASPIDRVFPEAVSAAALAHDLGHPPFGHAAEEELDNMISSRIDDGFEGNAQSFRIVNKVETNALFREFPDEDRGKGLNLTKRTLNAVLKYPWQRGEDIPDDIKENSEEKFGYFETEKSVFEEVRDGVRDYYRIPEAELMDWADDVTYAVHDLVDFYRVGMIPLGELLQEQSPEKDHFIDDFLEEKDDEMDDAFDPYDYLESIRNEVAVDDPEIQREYTSTRNANALIDLFQSELIEDLLRVPETVEYIPPDETEFEDGLGEIDINPVRRSEVEFLKHITFYYVIDNESLISQQQGERRAVLLMFDAFMKAANPEYCSQFTELGDYPIKMVPQPFRTELEGARNFEDRARCVVDAITSFTENQAVRMYERLSGYGPGSLTEEIT